MRIIIILRSLRSFVSIIETLIVVRVFMSWFRLGSDNQIVNFVYMLTEPIVGLARNMIQKIGINTGMFDFSPVIAMLFLQIIDSILIRLMMQI